MEGLIFVSVVVLAFVGVAWVSIAPERRARKARKPALGTTFAGTLVPITSHGASRDDDG